MLGRGRPGTLPRNTRICLGWGVSLLAALLLGSAIGSADLFPSHHGRPVRAQEPPLHPPASYRSDSLERELRSR